ENGPESLDCVVPFSPPFACASWRVAPVDWAGAPAQAVKLAAIRTAAAAAATFLVVRASMILVTRFADMRTGSLFLRVLRCSRLAQGRLRPRDRCWACSL